VLSNLRHVEAPGTTLKLNRAMRVERDPDRVFGELQDARTMLRCVPGAQVSFTPEAGVYEARMTLGVGPLKLACSGLARMTKVDVRARSATGEIEARGDVAGGRASASIAVRPLDTGSVVYIALRLTVDRSPAWLGYDLVDRIANRLLERSCERLKSQLEST
jgi:carbon monoxide dehydrogenase subunit G